MENRDLNSSSNDSVLISSAQVRAARGFLNWSQSDLANKCGLTKATVANIENEKHHLTSKTAKKITQAFINAKIEFIGNDGLRNCVDAIKTLEGRDGLCYLMNDIYNSLKERGGYVKATGIDENIIQENLGNDFVIFHDNKMQKLKKLSFRVLISNRDFNPYAKKYIEYRSISYDYFFPLPTYIYNGKVSFVNLNPLKILLIENFDLFLSYSKQFDMIWEKISEGI